MGFQINKGADRPPQVYGVVGLDYMIQLVKWVLGIAVAGGISSVFIPLPGWMIFITCGLAIYVVYLSFVKRSAKQGAGGQARIQIRRKLPGIITVRTDTVYRGLRKKT